MENASKALIIAGAILIAIVLITAGVLILGSAKNPIDDGSKAANVMTSKSSNLQARINESL